MIDTVFNYGALPQTWEDPNRIKTDEEGNRYGGDNDPIDAVEISNKKLRNYDVYKVKVIGALCLIDSGEVDWKLLVIDSTSNLSKTINNLGDFKSKMPDRFNEIKEWFRNYKIPEGKKQNLYLNDSNDFDIKESLEAINETHLDWVNMNNMDHDGNAALETFVE